MFPSASKSTQMQSTCALVIEAQILVMQMNKNGDLFKN